MHFSYMNGVTQPKSKGQRKNVYDYSTLLSSSDELGLYSQVKSGTLSPEESSKNGSFGHNPCEPKKQRTEYPNGSILTESSGEFSLSPHLMHSKGTKAPKSTVTIQHPASRIESSMGAGEGCTGQLFDVLHSDVPADHSSSEGAFLSGPERHRVSYSSTSADSIHSHVDANSTMQCVPREAGVTSPSKFFSESTKCKASAAASIEPQICCPLHNLGNTCYFNSCIQLLASCPAFLYGLRNSPFSQKYCIGGSPFRDLSAMNGSQRLYQVIARLFFCMEFKTPPMGSALSTKDVLDVLGDVHPTFEGRSQQDAAELLCSVLCTIEEEGGVLVDLVTLMNSFCTDIAVMRPNLLTHSHKKSFSLSKEGKIVEASPPPGEERKHVAHSLLPSASRCLSFGDGTNTESSHWPRLFNLMQQINDENEELEQQAYSRRQAAAGKKEKPLPPFRPRQLKFHDVVDTFTGYTVSETRCHSCGNVSRSVHDFRTLLLDIPSAKERSELKETPEQPWSFVSSGVGSFQRPRSHAADESRNPSFELSSPAERRKTQAPEVLQAFEAQHAAQSFDTPQMLSPNPEPSYFSSSNYSGTSHKSKAKREWGNSFWTFLTMPKKMFQKSPKKPPTLQECLQHHFKPFYFTGQNLYHCEACGEHAEATKTEYIAHLPSSLLIQMKRFESGSLYDSKKEDPVVFPVSWEPIRPCQPFSALLKEEVLDLSPFLHPAMRSSYRTCRDEEEELQDPSQRHHSPSPSVLSSGGRKDGVSTSSLPTPHAPLQVSFSSRVSEHSIASQPSGWTSAPLVPVSTYSLTAIVNHHGSLGGGHYTTYSRKTAPNGSKLWLQMNDTEISRVDEKTVADSEEYILMYEQQPPVFRPRSTDERLREMARFLLQSGGKSPCVTRKRMETGESWLCASKSLPRVPAATESPTEDSNAVYISRYWLQRAAFLSPPGPIMNRICYCSAADRKLPVPIPGVPAHEMRQHEDLPHCHLVPIEWFYLLISKEEYLAFYRHYGGNAWVLPSELEKMCMEQHHYLELIRPIVAKQHKRQ